MPFTQSSPMVTSCKSVIQFQKWAVDIDEVKIIPLVATPISLLLYPLFNPWQPLIYSPFL